jgi:hypothetical protein
MGRIFLEKPLHFLGDLPVESIHRFILKNQLLQAFDFPLPQFGRKVSKHLQHSIGHVLDILKQRDGFSHRDASEITDYADRPIADTFQIRSEFRGSKSQTQIAGHGPFEAKENHNPLVYGYLAPVQFVVLILDGLGQIQVAADQRLHCLLYLAASYVDHGGNPLSNIVHSVF